MTVPTPIVRAAFRAFLARHPGVKKCPLMVQIETFRQGISRPIMPPPISTSGATYVVGRGFVSPDSY